jgi:pimeloyl-ACP methyl ester carboxylesterase
MKKKNKRLLYIVLGVMAFYLSNLVFVYFMQEKLLFHPEVLTANYAFKFDSDYNEIYIPVDKDVKLHGVLFKAKQSKGLVFYLHGNGGSVKGRGKGTDEFTKFGYDLFILDYRGYGKSGGELTDEAQMNTDMQKAFEFMAKRYEHKPIIVAGYSIGTGPATELAANNKVKALILQAPYYSLNELIDSKVPFIPDFIKRYKFETFSYITKVTVPIYFFHGTADRLIPISNSVRLKQLCAHGAHLIRLDGAGHNGLNENQTFKNSLKAILD